MHRSKDIKETCASAYVKAWALLREEELKANWSLAVNGETTFRIDPLK
ncbi:MAG: hypothetical protein FWB93_01375 [Oscillospiraceae bacterium]|nr:hypothetical protein [Oscillospiraceae bacterium]